MINSSFECKPDELIQAGQLIVEGKFEEAHQLIEKFMEGGESTLKDTLLCNLLKIDILIQKGLFNDAIKLANQTYNKSLEIQENSLAFDAINLETIALCWLYRSDDVIDKIKQGEDVLKVINNDLPGDHKLRESSIEYLKAWYYLIMPDGDKSEEHSKLCLSLREELGYKRGLAEVLILSSYLYSQLKGDLDYALKKVELGLTFANDTNWRYYVALGLRAKGKIYMYKGDINQSILLQEQSLDIFKSLNNKPMMALLFNDIGWSYSYIRDLNRSLEYLELSLEINRELGLDREAANNILNMIINLIENHDLERAKQYLNDIEQMEICSKNKLINAWYRFCKALLLKTSLRAPYRGEAEVILKQILDEEVDDFELNVWTFFHLSELLLIEVRQLNDLEVLEELKSLIAQALEIAEKSQSYYLLTEIFFLNGKLALLTLDIKEARKALTQANRIAERWNFSQLATKISLEIDKLNSQLSMWDDLKEEEISISERIKLAGMDEQIEHLLRNRVSLTTQVKEKQITIHKERKICIVCKGDILGYMYACNCDALYCEKCARALTEIENLCWICNNPIDITKSIKPYEEEIRKEGLIKENYKNRKNKNRNLKK